MTISLAVHECKSVYLGETAELTQWTENDALVIGLGFIELDPRTSPILRAY
jgi:hypothetical protein